MSLLHTYIPPSSTGVNLKDPHASLGQLHNYCRACMYVRIYVHACDTCDHHVHACRSGEISQLRPCVCMYIRTYVRT